MPLCPISPHLAHPHSLHRGALSQAASSFWSQQQSHPINPLAGYATLYKRCCFLSYKSLNIISVLLLGQKHSQGPKPPPSTAGPVPHLPCGRCGQNIYAQVLVWDESVFQILKVMFLKKNKSHLQKQKAWVHLFWVGVNSLSLIKLYLIYNCMRGDSGPQYNIKCLAFCSLLFHKDYSNVTEEKMQWKIPILLQLCKGQFSLVFKTIPLFSC